MAEFDCPLSHLSVRACARARACVRESAQRSIAHMALADRNSEVPWSPALHRASHSPALAAIVGHVSGREEIFSAAGWSIQLADEWPRVT